MFSKKKFRLHHDLSLEKTISLFLLKRGFCSKRGRDRAHCIVATIRVDPSVLVFLAFISISVNNQCYNPYISGKIFSRSFQNVWVVALIVNRFRDNRQEHQHRRLNSYRGDYSTFHCGYWQRRWVIGYCLPLLHTSTMLSVVATFIKNSFKRKRS